jgi:predicted ATPase
MTNKVDRSEPRVEYTRRQGNHQRRADASLATENLLGNLRMGLFLGALVTLWLVVVSHLFHAVWLLVPAGIFVILGVRHERARRRRQSAERRAAFYTRALARLDGTWHGDGPTGSVFDDPPHPYAGDLDLFGDASLFQYLCAARTREGETTLATWLLAPADQDQILARQGAVRELAPMLDFREDLAVLGAEVGHRLEGPTLAEWAAGREPALTPASRMVAFGVAAVSAAAVIGWLLGLPGWVPMTALAGQMLFARFYRSTVRRVVADAERATNSLTTVVALLARLEREAFTDGYLRRLADALGSDGLPPSQAIARLERLANWLDSRRNPFAIPLFGLVMGTTQLAMAVEAWRRRYGSAVPRWLTAVGDFEALSSLAARAYDHPEDVFPTVHDGPPSFVAVGLGHPLLSSSMCVPNDVELNAEVPLWMVSGSNMSGKSTLLRAVGVNTVLALAGATVKASAMSLTPLQVVASIRISDSLQDGRSRFYAEILRLRQMMELAEKEPVLFLIDELLHGTNSHDRRIGAEAIVRGLLDRHAIGLVTTHDLALTTVDDGVPYAMRNVHLRDHLEAGEMVFDYRLHPGVVHHSNALALMKQVGLDVDQDGG